MPCSFRFPEFHLKYRRVEPVRAGGLGLATLAIVALSFWSCSSRGDPQAAFEHALQTLNKGDAAAATREADRGYEKFHRFSAEWAWKFVILKGRALYRRGMYDEALSILAAEPGAPTSAEQTIRKEWLEGLTYTSLHKFSEAERSFTQTDSLCEKSSLSACIDVASARGTLQMREEYFAEAQVSFGRVLSSTSSGTDPQGQAGALVDLSWSALRQTHFDEALDWAGAARQISIAHGFAGLAQTALGNMGWAYYKLGDPEKAQEYFIEAKNQAEKLGDAADEVRWLTNSGYIYMDAGDFKTAEQSFHYSFDVATKIGSREDIVNALIALAFVSQQSGKLEDAKHYADEALGMAEKDGSGRDAVYPLLVEGRIAAQEHDTATAEDKFRQVAMWPKVPVFLKWEAERSLARLYEDEKHADSADSEYRTALDTFETARCGLHERVDTRLPFLSNAARIYEDYIHFLVARGKTNQALQVAEYTRARTLAEGLGTPCKPKFAPDPLNAPEIARRASGTVLFYVLGQDHSYLWAITPRQIRLFPLAANQPEITAAVQRYRAKLEGPSGILDASPDGAALYQLLVAPAQDLLNQEAAAKNTNIFILPDGGLNSLNFETLTPQPHRYWIEDVTIANAASLRMLPALATRSTNLESTLLLIGNSVVPDTGPDDQYPELPNAPAQMAGIEKHFPAGRETTLARQQAFPAAYLNSHPEQFSYIHFVAHGTASRTNPLDSAIILSRDPASSATAGDDAFKLYARNIIGTPKLKAKLVTISACNSTGKRTYSGEGLVGLSWAFLHAGAHNVIGALWEVSDASTASLMDRLYGEIERGRTPESALRNAKLSLLHSSDASRRPFYWAPFQLYTGR
jgi:CHAT domain-containing protein/Flp pilus assembly protein TadD